MSDEELYYYLYDARKIMNAERAPLTRWEKVSNLLYVLYINSLPRLFNTEKYQLYCLSLITYDKISQM